MRAGWELVDELTLTELLAGAGAAAISAEAGVTTGAYYHHFPRPEDFAAAMVDHQLDRDPGTPLARERTRLEELGDGPFRAAEVPAEATMFLAAVDHEGARRTTARLMVLQSRDVDEAIGDSTIGDELRTRYWEPAEREQEQMWEVALELCERLTRQPYDLASLSTVVHALGTGILQRRLFAPDRLTPELFASALLLLMEATTNDAASPVSLAELEAGMSTVMRGTSTTVGRRRREISWAAAALLDKGWQTLTLNDVAIAVRAPEHEVARLFGTVRRVAAHAFGAVLRPREWFDERQVEGDPPEVLAVVEAIVSASRAHPELARALVAERNRDIREYGITTGEDDVREAVPLGGEVIRSFVDSQRDSPVTLRQLVEQVVTVVDAALMLGLRESIPIADAARCAADLMVIR